MAARSAKGLEVSQLDVTCSVHGPARKTSRRKMASGDYYRAIGVVLLWFFYRGQSLCVYRMDVDGFDWGRGHRDLVLVTLEGSRASGDLTDSTVVAGR